MLAAIRRQASHPFWGLVGLRLAFLLLTACTLLCSPLHTRVPVQRAYNGTTDLLFGSFDRWDAANFIYIARHGYMLWPRERGEWWRPLPALVALPAAVGGYALYLHYKLGDALAFDHAQKFWNRAHPTLGPLGGLKDALESGLRSGDLVLRHLPRGMAGPARGGHNKHGAVLEADPPPLLPPA